MKKSLSEKFLSVVGLLFLIRWFYLDIIDKGLPIVNQAGFFLIIIWLLLQEIQTSRQIKELKVEHSKEIFKLKLVLKKYEENKEETPNKSLHRTAEPFCDLENKEKK